MKAEVLMTTQYSLHFYRTGACYSSTGLLPPGLTADKVRDLNTKIQKLQLETAPELGEEEVWFICVSENLQFREF